MPMRTDVEPGFVSRRLSDEGRGIGYAEDLATIIQTMTLYLNKIRLYLQGLRF